MHLYRGHELGSKHAAQCPVSLGGEGRLKRLTVEKDLLREAESVQDQIRSLLKCQVCAAMSNHIPCWFDFV